MELNKLWNNIRNLFIRRLLSFEGRASRKEYIFRVLFFIFLLCIGDYASENNVYPVPLYLGLLYMILIIIIPLYMIQYFPLAVRRLHDFNVSGWFVLISFVPFGQLLILWLMFKKGTEGSNDYGEPPAN